MDISCCRICMQNAGLFSLFSVLDSGKMISEFAVELADIDIFQGDGLPETICPSCILAFENAIQIKILCQESDRRLREILVEDLIIEDCSGQTNGDENEEVQEELQLLDEKREEADEMNKRIFLENMEETEIYDDQIDENEIIHEEITIMPIANDEGQQIKTFLVLDIQEKLCCGCSEKFQNVEQLMDHSKLVHENERIFNDIKPYECSICYKRFTTVESIFLHQNDKIRYKKYQCKLCDKQYADKKGLKYHEKTHRNEKNFKCTVCLKRFRCKSSLNMHTKLHSEKNIKNFKCEICDKLFLRKSDLQSHLVSHTFETPFSCTLCPMKFKRKQHLTSHMKIHLGKDKTYKCRHCDEAFVHTSSRKNHESKQHTGIYPFNCSFCEKSFSRKALYVKHMEKHVHKTVDNVDGIEFLEEIIYY